MPMYLLENRSLSCHAKQYYYCRDEHRTSHSLSWAPPQSLHVCHRPVLLQLAAGLFGFFKQTKKIHNNSEQNSVQPPVQSCPRSAAFVCFPRPTFSLPWTLVSLIPFQPYNQNSDCPLKWVFPPVPSMFQCQRRIIPPWLDLSLLVECSRAAD